MCYTGINVASVLSNGDIYGCPDVARNPKLIQGNIRKDKLSDVWENRFEYFRNFDRTSNKKCKACQDWQFCLGDAFHTWDWEENKPNLCVREIFKEDYIKRDKLIREYNKLKKELEKKR